MPLSPAPSQSEIFTARIRTVMPDSPALAIDSGDDWAVSSLGADFMSDMEEELHVSSSSTNDLSEPSLIMPRLIMPLDASGNQVTGPIGGSGQLTAPIGKLGVLVAGSTGSGKSRLVETLISECPVIVDSTGPLSTGDRPEFVQRRAKSLPVSHIAGSHVDDHFNIVFVETAGHGMAAAQETESLASFLEARFCQTATLINGLNPTSLQILRNSWSLGQFSHIDVCLYMLDEQVTKQDVETLRLIARYAAVVPLLAKSDVLDSEQLASRKFAVSQLLKEHHIETFSFEDSQLDYPPAISTNYDMNYDMTMSEVMAPGYRSHVLVHSEIQELMSQLFSDRGALQVREFAARRFSEWVASRSLSYGAKLAQYPVLIPSGIQLDMNWALSCRGEMQLSLTDAPKMQPIGNVDPLQLFKWNNRVLRLVMMLAAAAFSLSMLRQALARFFASPTEYPPSPPVAQPPPHRRLGTLLRELMGNFQIVVA